ncbi:MAG: hypothetical protein LBU66_06855 [Treponema sp.]|nr:hypothetical protein [Treponema sp.]
MTSARLVFIFVILFFLPVVLFARDIQVYVEDEDLAMPLDGAVVALRNGQQFICDYDGIAHITLPDDRQTIVSVAYPGYETFRLIIPARENAETTRFTATLRLGGIMQGQELVLEAARPETSETRTGRSVAITERDLERTAEIGIIEDVMSSVKLLPGVGYSGMFSAMPSIRGGDPGDLMAALDGFYLERPYYWMGSISIFDPKMVSSARLSHGVFSARYGHTISGLLEVTSKSPSQTETELEVALGSSATSLNLSLPFGGRGGLLFMGKVTYWDTLVWAAQGLSTVVDDENLDMINYVTTSPYIRSAALSANYRITAGTDWRLNAFFGSDGIGMEFNTDYSRFMEEDLSGNMELHADYANYQGFVITGINSSPSPKLALRFLGGVGFNHVATEEFINMDITAPYNEEFIKLFEGIDDWANKLRNKKTYTAPNANAELDLVNTIINAQLRADADFDLGNGFITAFGIQELYSSWALKQDISLNFIEFNIDRLPQEYKDGLRFMYPGKFPILDLPSGEYAALIRPMGYSSDVQNHGFTTSTYGLLEYASPNQRLGAELGLRLDHMYFIGNEFTLHTEPALNPRLNIDFGLLKNTGFADTLTMTMGTGLFSSTNTLISFLADNIGLDDDTVKFNRSWTSVLGFKLDFLESYSFNIEGYYKRVFDRAYISADITSSESIAPTFHFDGIGNVWGFDLQLQKMESRYFDGWISYTFTWAKYHDPSSGSEGVGSANVEHWYYPSFHRFHNCNIVLNIKPLDWFNIGVRFGFASGRPRRKIGAEIYPYPVQVIDEKGAPLLDEEGDPVIIQKYRRDSWYDENERSPWLFPLDVKFSFYLANKTGKTGLEIYVAAENLMSLVYQGEENVTFNEYTGKEDVGSSTGSFELPIPLVSFGFKWRY